MRLILRVDLSTFYFCIIALRLKTLTQGTLNESKFALGNFFVLRVENRIRKTKWRFMGKNTKKCIEISCFNN